MSAHARLGPSDSARWLSCPGSINFTRDYPNSSSAAADEGTVAHWVREQCLELGFEPYDFIGTKMRLNGVLWEVDEDMAENLVYGIDTAREFDGPMFVEKRLDLGRWMPGQFGTLDCGIAGEHLIYISDLKFGRGVPVQAAYNTQQMIYALGFWDQIARHITDATEFLIEIDQPRNNAGGGAWRVSLEDLLKFGEELRKKAAATFEEDAPLIASPKACQWCAAANVPGRIGGCPVNAAANLEPIDMDFDDLDGPDLWEPPVVEELSRERLITLSQHKKSIEQFLEYAHARALQYLMDDGPAAGHKAVYGRKPPRKWASTEAAEAFMKQKLSSADPFNKKLKTPSQAEKEVGKKYEIPKSLVEQGQPKPIMVPVEDEREAIRPFNDDIEDLDADDEFDNLDDL